MVAMAAGVKQPVLPIRAGEGDVRDKTSDCRSCHLAQKSDCQIGDRVEELKHDLLICLTEAEKEKSLVH